ncbi:head-tail connector protein [Rhizobacter sp. Root1221]|uniref:head-tail connector protein n=1 Tax=Rhizobacter sp. Root1221 TaxID=1736433 RepID=UPI0006F25FC9|nr:head-tail connector protein [Rhizobacter sp. Root1221]KQV85441.1 hypothetical protein ASC87_07045 [Rhizobacter sp. Root1221]
MNLRIVTSPTFEPVSMLEVFQHCRIDGDPEDPPEFEAGILPVYIQAAREHAEAHTGLVLTDAVYQLRVDAFCDPLPLPVSPVGSIASLRYIDADGVEQLLDDAAYWLDDDPGAPSVRPVYGSSWPDARDDVGAIRINFQAPYVASDSTAAVPASIKQAMLLMIGHWYENREQVVLGTIATQVPMGASMLLDFCRWSPRI